MGGVSKETESILTKEARRSGLSAQQTKALLQSAREQCRLPAQADLHERRKAGGPADSRTSNFSPSPFPTPVTHGQRGLRSQALIEHSGAYEREQFPGAPLGMDREHAKTKLATQHEHDGLSDEEVKARQKRAQLKQQAKVPLNEREIMQRIEQEIEERVAFLDDMERYGEADKYRDQITHEIQCRQRELERLKTLTTDSSDI